MLGIQKESKDHSSLSLDTLNIKQHIPKFPHAKHVKKPKGMSRETFDLLSDQKKLALVQGLVDPTTLSAGTAPTAPRLKSKLSSAFKGKWIWSDVPSSSRNDDPTPFYHWIKRDFHYADYPYAKFNIKLEQTLYTDEEYELLLVNPEWSRQDTDALFATCYRFDLRWPIIADRVQLSSKRTLDAMQARFNSAVTAIKHHRTYSDTTAVGDGAVVVEDGNEGDRERFRRMQQDIVFKLNKADEKTDVNFIKEPKVKEEKGEGDTGGATKKRKPGRQPGTGKNQLKAKAEREANGDFTDPAPKKIKREEDGSAGAPGVTTSLQSSRLRAPFPPRTHKKKQDIVKQYLSDKFGLNANAVQPTSTNVALIRSIHKNAIILVNAQATKKPSKKMKQEDGDWA
jgi:hypothetical protein